MYITKIEIEIRQSKAQKLTEGTAYVVLSSGDEWRIEPVSTHYNAPEATCSRWRRSHLDRDGWCDGVPGEEAEKALRPAEEALRWAIWDAHEVFEETTGAKAPRD